MSHKTYVRKERQTIMQPHAYSHFKPNVEISTKITSGYFIDKVG